MEDTLFNNKSEFSLVNSSKLNDLQRLVEDLVINKVRLEGIKNEVIEQEIRIISSIQDTVKKMSKVKMENVYSSITIMVDKYNKDLGKEIKLILKGAEEEVDCSVFDLVQGVLNYFVKYAADDNSNEIKLTAISDSKNLTITVDRNSKNFDYDKICSNMKKEYLTIVSKGIDGHAAIVIPVTSAITQAQIVSINDQMYAIPLEYIETIMNKTSVQIKKTNDMQAIVYMDKVLPLIKVRERLNITLDNETSKCILIVKAQNHTAALLVDDILDQTDVVIRQKPKVISDIVEFSGTTILGDGIVTLVLDVTSLIVKR